MLRHIISNELLTILLTIGFIIVAISKLVAPKRFDDFILILGNDKYLQIYSKDQKIFNKFDVLLSINLILSASIFCFIIYNRILEGNTIALNTMLKFTFSMALFILVKTLIERFIGNIFEIDKLMDLYLFRKIGFKNYLGILLLPINALLLYSFKPTLPIVYSLISILLVINSIGLISAFKTHQNLIKNNLLYFILYLCALEIAPYIILYKVFTSK